MQNKNAKTAAEYLAALPAERRKEVAKVRAVLNKSLPKGYVEMAAFGMIGYGIPLSRYPDTYNGQPLCYAGLAAQKNYCSLYLMSVYGSKPHLAMLQDAFKAAGKKLDMGKSCIHFQTADNLPLEAIGKIVASIPSEAWIAMYESSRSTMTSRSSSRASSSRASARQSAAMSSRASARKSSRA